MRKDPAMYTASAIMPHISQSRERERAVWYLGSFVTFLATSEETGGQFSLMESVLRKGATTVFHTHREDESFYMLEGEVSYYLGDRVLAATTGTFLTVPRGVSHSFLVVSETARVLTLFTPGGYEGFFREMGEPARALTLPPPPVGTPDMARMSELGAKYGSTMTGPPPSGTSV